MRNAVTKDKFVTEEKNPLKNGQTARKTSAGC
jgi:hypothetical protein